MSAREDHALFGPLVKARRTDLGLTQKAVADAVGIGAPYLSKIENAREFPPPALVHDLAMALEIHQNVAFRAAGMCTHCFGTGRPNGNATLGVTS